MVLLLICGCTPQDNSKVQSESARAARETKQDATDMAQDSKKALQSAENTVNAAATGVTNGIKSKTGPDTDSSSNGKTPAGKIDLNSASHDQLVALPGITSAKADAIMAGRPYDSPRGVVTKGILTPVQFHRIAPEVAVQ